MDRCPACHSVNTSTEHLVEEYAEGMRDCFGAMFGHNARKVQDELGRELLTRGVTHIANLFGPIAVQDNWERR